MAEKKSPNLRRYVVCAKCDGTGQAEEHYSFEGKVYTNSTQCVRCKASGHIDILRESWLKIVIHSLILVSLPIAIVLFLQLFGAGLSRASILDRGGQVADVGLYEAVLYAFLTMASFFWVLLGISWSFPKLVESIQIVRGLILVKREKVKDLSFDQDLEVDEDEGIVLHEEVVSEMTHR